MSSEMPDRAFHPVVRQLVLDYLVEAKEGRRHMNLGGQSLVQERAVGGQDGSPGGGESGIFGKYKTVKFSQCLQCENLVTCARGKAEEGRLGDDAKREEKGKIEKGLEGEKWEWKARCSSPGTELTRQRHRQETE